MKISKGLSEAVNRWRRVNAMTKRKKRGNGTHTDVQNTTETKNRKTYTTKVIGTLGRKL